jgi:hypothetical protein
MADSLTTPNDRAILVARGQNFSIDHAVDQYLELLLTSRASRKRS